MFLIRTYRFHTMQSYHLLLPTTTSSVTKGPVNGYSLFHTLTEDNLAVSGATGEVKLKSNGDRNENGKNFTLLNAYLTGNNA